MTDPAELPERQPDLPAGIRLPATFASLRHPAYRLYFVGQVVSLVGMWMQNAAQQWVVYDLTGSEAWLGIVGAAGTLPVLLLSMVGGVLADRFSRRRILMATQVASAVPALALGLLIATGRVEVWHIVALAVASGVVSGFDMPARHSFVFEMVGRADLMNAIALNSAVFHGARVIGPVVAGLLIGTVGSGPCFFVNSATYFVLLGALAIMRPGFSLASGRADGHGHDPFAGFRLLRQIQGLAGILFVMLLVGVFGWSYVVLLPAFAREVLAVEADGFGVLLAAIGTGAVAGSLTMATVRSVRDGRAWMSGAILLFALALVGFSWAPGFASSLVFLSVTGFGLTAFFSLANTLFQSAVDDAVRGRAMGLYSLVFGLMMPVGALQAGMVAEALGSAWAVRIGAFVCLAVAAGGFAWLPRRLGR